MGNPEVGNPDIHLPLSLESLSSALETFQEGISVRERWIEVRSSDLCERYIKFRGEGGGNPMENPKVKTEVRAFVVNCPTR